MCTEIHWLRKAEKNELRKKIVHEDLRLEDCGKVPLEVRMWEEGTLTGSEGQDGEWSRK